MKPHELAERYTFHPLGFSLRNLTGAPDEETRQTAYVVVLTIAELLYFQKELTKEERDWFISEAHRQVNNDQVQH
ncbi:hypothetical protein [Marinobacter sp.]|uniref:hypothetical protein n=1 Tax=Marinobacter sp. TaxID=50741 RepID=UPI0035C73C3E